MEYVRERQGTTKQLIYPGWHTQWTSVALPPFLIAPAANAVIEQAETELRTRLRHCLESYRKSMSPKRHRSASQMTDPEESPMKKQKMAEDEDELLEDWA